jgi:hypothetical protein
MAYAKKASERVAYLKHLEIMDELPKTAVGKSSNQICEDPPSRGFTTALDGPRWRTGHGRAGR